jgi:hypothetical protein
VAQIGSVIGRGFSYVATWPEWKRQAALEKLADADIVLVQGLPPESELRRLVPVDRETRAGA